MVQQAKTSLVMICTKVQSCVPEAMILDSDFRPPIRVRQVTTFTEIRFRHDKSCSSVWRSMAPMRSWLHTRKRVHEKKNKINKLASNVENGVHSVWIPSWCKYENISINLTPSVKRWLSMGLGLLKFNKVPL